MLDQPLTLSHMRNMPHDCKLCIAMFHNARKRHKVCDITNLLLLLLTTTTFESIKDVLELRSDVLDGKAEDYPENRTV